jgi:predicted Zn-dependent protease
MSLNTQTIVPWAALGIATLALVVALAALFGRGSEVAPPAPVRFSQSLATPFPDSAQPPDLSSMTPREAADRLFNRVMAASENGNQAEASQFTPMALQAYANLGNLDNDARYHVALLHLTANDTRRAQTQIDLLRKSAPKHLLAFMLEHQIAKQSGKQDNATRAFKAFLTAYDAEIAVGQADYQDHLSSIERVRTAARAGVANK